MKIKHAGNTHPKPRNMRNPPKLIAGQTDKKTGHSRLSASDRDSQRHEPQTSGHGMRTKPVCDCGYARPEHHTDGIKHWRR